MSCPTENTVVVKAADSKLFARLWKDNECEHRLSDLRKVFENDTLTVFIFDCNGSPSFIDESSIFPLIVETYYLDNEEPITEYDWNYFNRKDSVDCNTLLSQLLTEEEMSIVSPKITYSISSESSGIDVNKCSFSEYIAVDEEDRLDDSKNGEFGYRVFYSVPKEEIKNFDCPENFDSGEIEFTVDKNGNLCGEILLWFTVKTENGLSNKSFVELTDKELTRKLALLFKEKELRQ